MADDKTNDAKVPTTQQQQDTMATGEEESSMMLETKNATTSTTNESSDEDGFTPPAQNASAAAFAQIFVDHPDALDAMQELENMDAVRNEPGISWEEFQQKQTKQTTTATEDSAT